MVELIRLVADSVLVVSKEVRFRQTMSGGFNIPNSPPDRVRHTSFFFGASFMTLDRFLLRRAVVQIHVDLDTLRSFR